MVCDTAGNLDPSSAKIACAVDMWAEIIESKTIDCGIGSAGVEVGSLNDGDFTPGLELRRRDVFPVFSSVACELDLAIVRTSPDRVCFLEGRGDGIYRATMLAFFGVASLERAEIWRKFVRFAGEVRTDNRLAAALVDGLEQNVGGKVQCVGI